MSFDRAPGTGAREVWVNDLNLARLGEHIGKELGVSDWVAIDQSRIDAFASCTGDHQWIHVDTERAKRESPFGGTVAHGYLTLSLLPAMRSKAEWKIAGYGNA